MGPRTRCRRSTAALSFLLALALASHATHSQSTTTSSQPPLLARAATDGLRFKILQLADLHFTGDLTFPCLNTPAELAASTCTEALMSAFVDDLLDAEKPDFVVFSGDNVQVVETSDEARQRAVDAFTKGTEQRRIPFAVVLGNHDDENGFAREDVLRRTMAKTSSHTQRGPTTVDGVGNYQLSVRAPTDGPWGSANDAVFHMYFLDSGGYPDRTKYPAVSSFYDWIKPSQVAYYRNLSSANYEKQQQQNKSKSKSVADAKSTPPLPAVMFFHIPLIEFNYSQADAVNVFGEKHDPVSSSTVASEMFSALVERNEVKAVFVGHDHLNEYCYNRQGVQLCYGGGAGLGLAYGDSSFARRARVIEWSVDTNNERSIRSWKRLYGKTSATCCHETLTGVQTLQPGNSTSPTTAPSTGDTSVKSSARGSRVTALPCHPVGLLLLLLAASLISDWV